MFPKDFRLTLAAASVVALAQSPGRYWYVGASDGTAAITYASDSVWVYVSSPQGPFAFHASTATMATWADSARATRFPHGNTARFQYYDAAAGDTILLQLTRMSGDSSPSYQCTALLAGWTAAIVLPNDSAQQFFALLHGKPLVASPSASTTETTYFDYQVEKQAGLRPGSPRTSGSRARSMTR